ncbi:MAG TPA: hypothetical protein VGO40_13035 [Longimicrobium sp.]|jgi:hypothetical protein|nr:hypothetical protein [Longimicrobium sp.]
MNRTLRIFAVTAGLLAAGAVAGALAAAGALLIGLWVSGERVGGSGTEMFGFAAMVGAFFGGLLLPATAWIFLRRVPLGLAVLGTLLGTIVGGALGWVIRMGPNEIQGGLVGAFAGFAAAALLLRLRASAPRVRRAVSTRG